jgi:hypothetical protein
MIEVSLKIGNSIDLKNYGAAAGPSWPGPVNLDAVNEALELIAAQEEQIVQRD